jgi:hypothetical protein
LHRRHLIYCLEKLVGLLNVLNERLVLKYLPLVAVETFHQPQSNARLVSLGPSEGCLSSGFYSEDLGRALSGLVLGGDILLDLRRANKQVPADGKDTH